MNSNAITAEQAEKTGIKTYERSSYSVCAVVSVIKEVAIVAGIIAISDFGPSNHALKTRTA
jgi:hypothetical protein